MKMDIYYLPSTTLIKDCTFEKDSCLLNQIYLKVCKNFTSYVLMSDISARAISEWLDITDNAFDTNALVSVAYF